MTPEAMRDVLDRYVAGVNAHDVEAMMALRHPDAFLEVAGSGLRVDGRDALGRFYRGLFAELPDFRLDMEASACGDDVAAVWGTLRATVRDRWFGAPASGGEVEAPVCFVCGFTDGAFLADRMFVDTGLAARQAGVAPALSTGGAA